MDSADPPPSSSEPRLPNDGANASGRRTHVGSEPTRDRPERTAANETRRHEPSQAFRAYVVPELGILYAVARRLTLDSHDAEDLVQETLLRAYRSIERFDGRYPRAWLLTILRNANINRARKRTPDLLHDEERTLGALPASGPDGRSDGAAEEAIARIPDDSVVEALRRLSDNHRAVVALVDIDGLSYREAAEVLDVPVGTVMSRLHRARNKLRTRLERAGVLEVDR